MATGSSLTHNYSRSLSEVLRDLHNHLEDISALDRFNVHRCPTRWVFSATGFEHVTRQATVRYLYHSSTADTALQ
ncbi:hypothetical protein TNCV_441481 [Trichonephila clavipes]|nr:hypothetical protein TNCV_441481 [Trichonephila clavipes]